MAATTSLTKHGIIVDELAGANFKAPPGVDLRISGSAHLEPGRAQLAQLIAERFFGGLGRYHVTGSIAGVPVRAALTPEERLAILESARDQMAEMGVVRSLPPLPKFPQ